MPRLAIILDTNILYGDHNTIQRQTKYFFFYKLMFSRNVLLVNVHSCCYYIRVNICFHFRKWRKKLILEVFYAFSFLCSLTYVLATAT
jgi:hypothetical protein